MTDRFVEPFARFFTTDLKTLPGAKLYFYENGTTAPKAIYRDPFKNNTHANPVIAGTFGAPADAFPAIYMDGTYTVELKSSAGVTQSGWPQDNIGGEQVEGNFDSWSAINSYSIGDLVTGSDGNRYEATANNNLNYDPTVLANRTGYWKQVFIIGEYVSTETYGAGDYITYDNGLFKCVQAATGQNPNTAHAYWQRIHNVPHWGSTSTYRQYDRVIDSNGVIQVSQQNGNINHSPVGDSGTWWKPEWQISPALSANYLSGGGSLSAYRNNVLTDASTYTLPLANSVPANAILVISMLDTHKAFQPTVQRSGSDLIRRAAGTDTAILMQQGQKVSFTLITNGVDEWRI